MLYGCIGLWHICLHKVDAGKELICGINTTVIDAGDIHKHGQACAGADKHSLKAILFLQLIYGDGAAYNGIRGDGNSQSLKAIHFLLHYCLGQTELGNAVYQHAARKVQRFEYGNLISHAGKVTCAGKACGAGAHHSHLMSVGLGLFGQFFIVAVMPVRHKALQAANAHRLALYAANTVLFALALLGAYPAAYGGQCGSFGYYLICLFKVALGSLSNKLGDVYHNGAAGHTGLMLAVKAALCLIHGLLRGIAQSYLFKVLVAYIRLLGGHGVLFQ